MMHHLIAKTHPLASQGPNILGIAGGVLLNIPADLGPGYLQMSSPDCFVEWRVSKSQDLSDFDQVLRTGPASLAGLYLPSGGTASYFAHYAATENVNEYNGFITRNRAEPKVKAQFYPGLTARPKAENKRFVTIGSGPGSDRVPLSAGSTLIAFAPSYCRTAAVSSETIGGATVVQVVDASTGVIRVSRSVNLSPGALPFVVSAWEVLQILVAIGFNPSPSIVWSESTDIYT
jgi:hypothetical protein